MRHSAGITQEEAEPEPEYVWELECGQGKVKDEEHGSYWLKKMGVSLTSFQLTVKPDAPLSQILSAIHSKYRCASQDTKEP
jgi:hypothetical protein